MEQTLEVQQTQPEAYLDASSGGGSAANVAGEFYFRVDSIVSAPFFNIRSRSWRRRCSRRRC